MHRNVGQEIGEKYICGMHQPDYLTYQTCFFCVRNTILFLSRVKAINYQILMIFCFPPKKNDLDLHRCVEYTRFIRFRTANRWATIFALITILTS